MASASSSSNIKDRCRLCYTRLKDPSTSHHKLWCSRDHHRIYNIYKRRPYRYRDLIVRYLYIHLPENETNINENNAIDHYSRVVCGNCAASLNQLDQAFRTFQQTRKVLRSKFRKTSQIVHYQLDKQRVNALTKSLPEKRSPSASSEVVKIHDEKLAVPKRQSKRKGEPKHIDQTLNHQPSKPTSNGVQLIVRAKAEQEEERETSQASSMPSTRTSPRRKAILPTNDLHATSSKKKFKRLLINDQEASNCINLLKPSILTDIPINNHSFPLNLTTLSGSLSTSNNRSLNSIKGNHIERIAFSLLAGSDTVSSAAAAHASSNPPNGTHNHHAGKPALNRKKGSSLDLSTTNNILSPVVRSPSIVDEPDDDRLSIDGTSDASSGASRSIEPSPAANIPNVNKNLSAMISTTPTAEGLTITAINPTGQKQVFMAKQLGNLKKYQCGLCEKIVTNIQIHVRRHTNDKPYPCTYCEKRFTNSGDLQIHVRIHTGEKPYACPLCLKSYRTIGNFNSHVKTHDSGTRPHRCELCSQIFPIPKDWYSHLRSSHRSRTANSEGNNALPASSSSSLNTSKTTTTVTKQLFPNSLSSQQQRSETFIPSKVKLEPINRSQLVIKSTTENPSDEEEEEDDGDQEPVNMSKKREFHEEDEEQENADDEEEEIEEEQHQSTRNLLSNVASPVRA